MWNKYGPYASPHIQSTWLYSEPTLDLIQQEHSIKADRMNSGKTNPTTKTSNSSHTMGQEGRLPKRQQVEGLCQSVAFRMGSPLKQDED